jgi:hypothetical protein
MKIAMNAVLTKVMTMMESVILKMMKPLGVALLFPSPYFFFLPLVQTAWQYKQGLSNKKLLLFHK